MTESYFENDYTYAVARIRTAELSLIRKDEMKMLAGAGSAEEVISFLKSKNYGESDSETPEELLQAERKKLWVFADEIVKEKNALDVFRFPADYSNLKAAIRESVQEMEFPGIWLEGGTAEPALIRKAVAERKYQLLPGEMAFTAMEAHNVFLRTGDGQLCDVIVDKGCMEAVQKSGRNSGNAFLAHYASLFAASADIRIAVRAALTKKSGDFLNMALCDTEEISIPALKAAAESGFDSVCAFLSTTIYAGAAAELQKSVTAFECWCDNHIIEEIRGELYESFGIGPIAAYIIAKQTEMKSLRIILSGKENGFSEKMITERVRETYV